MEYIIMIILCIVHYVMYYDAGIKYLQGSFKKRHLEARAIAQHLGMFALDAANPFSIPRYSKFLGIPYGPCSLLGIIPERRARIIARCGPKASLFFTYKIICLYDILIIIYNYIQIKDN